MTKKTKKEVNEGVLATEIEQPTMASGVDQAPAPTIDDPTPKERAKKTKAVTADITLEELAMRYLAHLEESGKSNGTLFSYKLELITALDEIGKDTKLVGLTSARVLDYFVSDRVMRTKSGVEKAAPTYKKTRRVLRLALVWAQDAGFIEKAPVPEDAASY